MCLKFFPLTLANPACTLKTSEASHHQILAWYHEAIPLLKPSRALACSPHPAASVMGVTTGAAGAGSAGAAGAGAESAGAAGAGSAGAAGAG